MIISTACHWPIKTFFQCEGCSIKAKGHVDNGLQNYHNPFVRLNYNCSWKVWNIMTFFMIMINEIFSNFSEQTAIT